MVAIYSYNTQTQGVAYSIDSGRTWTKYANNPVIDALAPDFRDPKVFWHEEMQKWVMVIAAGKVIKFFNSDDLLDWEFKSDFTDLNFYGGVWEVPDLFPLTYNDEIKWVLIVSINPGGPAGGSGTRYYIGDFDGETFIDANPQELTWLDYGADNYAGTIFYNAPDNQRIHIGWMNNWDYAQVIPTSIWRGSMTIPREIALVDTPNGLRLTQTPIAELTKLRQPLGVWEEIPISGIYELENVEGRTLEIIAVIEPGSAIRSGLSVHHNGVTETRIMYVPMVSQVLISRSDRVDEEFIRGFTTAFGAPIELADNRLKLHLYVDESSVEVFVNDGITVLTGRTFGDALANVVTLFADNGDAILSHLEVYSLRSIWTNEARESAQNLDICD